MRDYIIHGTKERYYIQLEKQNKIRDWYTHTYMCIMLTRYTQRKLVIEQ